MTQNTTFNRLMVRGVVYTCVVAGLLVAVNACRKNTATNNNEHPLAGNASAMKVTTNFQQSQPQTVILSVAGMRTVSGVEQVFFTRNQEVFSVQDATVLATLKSAMASGTPVKVTINPWTAQVAQATTPTSDELAAFKGNALSSAPSNPVKIDLSSLPSASIDNIGNNNILPALMPLNTTVTDSLVGMIPDLATAQLMFNYITKQCCALSGPYAIDYCISFQYCEDGCYARAHKMCWIINNKFNYATQKVFSFANSGSDQLSVKGEKWGGCCINWWYHVAPLVTIKTPTGPKAYVFDPAMFDQPVLLSAWLHAQENPACVSGSSVAHVSMINVQPTASYSPASYSGYTFDTDPAYASTDTTLVHYSVLTTCP